MRSADCWVRVFTKTAPSWTHRTARYMSELPHAVSTAVTCRPSDANGYLSHLPQNLGDGGWIWSRGSPYPTLHNFSASHNLSCCPAIYNRPRGTYETPLESHILRPPDFRFVFGFC